MPQAQQDRNLTLDGRRGASGHASTDGQGPLDSFAAEGDLLDVAGLLAEIEGLRQRLATQPVIEQAKGILMGHYRISNDTAFQLLRHWSQDSNTKVRHIAELLTESASSGAGDRLAPHQIVEQNLATPPTVPRPRSVDTAEPDPACQIRRS